MALTFYPHTDDLQKGTLEEKIDVLMEAAERYKAAVLEIASAAPPVSTSETNNHKKRGIPRDQTAAYNWEEIARILREIRELPEGAKGDRIRKSQMLSRLAEVYEVLRGAKMSKLEAVRLALLAESSQLRGGSSQVA